MRCYHNFTRVGFVVVTVLLIANLVTMLLKNPAPAYAQGGKLRYKELHLGETCDQLNREVANGWRVKGYAAFPSSTVVLLER